MKVNANRVRTLREDRAWTQEALADAAGLNLRTVQRIENDAAGSRRSIQALAAVLGIDARTLDDDASPAANRVEYRIVEIEPEDGFLTRAQSAEAPELLALLNTEGEEGWMLVQILTPEVSQRLRAGRTGRFAALMQRKSRVVPPTDDAAHNARTRR